MNQLQLYKHLHLNSTKKHPSSSTRTQGVIYVDEVFHLMISIQKNIVTSNTNQIRTGQIFLLPSSARDKVTPSAYSISAPIGKPCPILVIERV